MNEDYKSRLRKAAIRQERAEKLVSNEDSEQYKSLLLEAATRQEMAEKLADDIPTRYGIGVPGHVQANLAPNENKVSLTIAKGLPDLPQYKDYTAAKDKYTAEAKAGKLVVNFPVFKTKKTKRGKRKIFDHLEFYSLGEMHHGLKRPVHTKDALQQAKELITLANNTRGYSKESLPSNAQEIVTEKHGGTLDEYAQQNIDTHDIAEHLQNTVRELPESSLSGVALPWKENRHREIREDGKQFHTTTEHPEFPLTKRIGIVGTVKRARGGNKTRKHRRHKKHETRKHKRKSKKHKRKTKKHKRKTKRKTKKHKRKSRR